MDEGRWKRDDGFRPKMMEILKKKAETRLLPASLQAPPKLLLSCSTEELDLRP